MATLSKEPRPRRIAILISGEEASEEHPEFWFDLEMLSSTLKSRGLKFEIPLFFYANGHEPKAPLGWPLSRAKRPDIYAATYQNLFALFRELNGKGGNQFEIGPLGPQDELYVHTIGHGSIYAGGAYLDLQGSGILLAELVNTLKENPAGRKTLVMTQCYSGAAQHYVSTGKKLEVFTACSEGQSAYRGDEDAMLLEQNSIFNRLWCDGIKKILEKPAAEFSWKTVHASAKSQLVKKRGPDRYPFSYMTPTP